MSKPRSMNPTTALAAAAISLLAIGCSQSSGTQVVADAPAATVSDARESSTVAAEQAPDAPTPGSVDDSDQATPPTYRTDVTELAPPESVEAESISFSSRIVTDPTRDGLVLVETQILKAPEGTDLFEIVINGRVRGGSSYAPGVVGVVPLRDDTKADVEVRAYDIDKELLGAATLDQVLTLEEN